MGTALFGMMCVVCLILWTKILRLKEKVRDLTGEGEPAYYERRTRWNPWRM